MAGPTSEVSVYGLRVKEQGSKTINLPDVVSPTFAVIPFSSEIVEIYIKPRAICYSLLAVDNTDAVAKLASKDFYLHEAFEGKSYFNSVGETRSIYVVAPTAMADGLCYTKFERI